MCKEALEKYLQSFKLFLPFILVKLAFEITTFNINDSTVGVDKYSFIKKGTSLGNMGPSIWENICVILVSLFVAPLFYSILQLVIKNIISEDEINYKNSFRESLRFYLRYLGLILIIVAILLGIMLLSLFTIMLPILMIGVVILVVYVCITTVPCTSYLMYYDTSPEEALSKGRALGKKYFWSIFFVGLITVIINVIITFIMNTIIKVNPDTNLIAYSIITFITTTMEFYMYMFTMYICREEEPLSDDRLESTEDR